MQTTDTDWLIDDALLETRRRAGGRRALDGFGYQKAFALLKVAEMIAETSPLRAVRYEGAQDVDLKYSDGRVELVQLKNEPDETYPAATLAKMIVGFAHDLLDAHHDPRLRFRAVVRASPGSPALQRLASGKPSIRDLREFARGLGRDQRFTSLPADARQDIARSVAQRLAIDRGQGFSSERPAFDIFAAENLRTSGIAGEHVDRLIETLHVRIRPGHTITREEALEWASRFWRHAGSLTSAPAPPERTVARSALTGRALDQLTSTRMAVLCGTGGSGKTTLAALLASDPTVRAAFPDGVLWITLGRDPDVGVHLNNILRAVGRPAVDSRDLNALRDAARTALAGRSALLVLDDVWNPAHLSFFERPAGGGLLVTTRSPRIAASLGVEPLNVGAMSPEEALRLFEANLGRPAGRDRPAIEAFGRRVSHLPLALQLGSLLVREGRTLERIQRELDAEATRLAALDLDHGDADLDADERRASVSVEASIGVSVAAVEANLRRAFYELGVLPEQVEIEPELAALVFNCTAERALDILQDLSARGLLERSSGSDDPTFRIHDLVHDYARSAFGPRRTALAGIPDGLGATSADLHRRLLDRALSRTDSGLWSQVVPAMYFDQRLTWHFTSAGRPECIPVLLREELGGSAAWLSRQRRHLGRFMDDVAKCLGVAADALLGESRPQSDARFAMDALLTAAGSGACATERARRVPVGLLPQLVRTGQLPVEDAIAQARLGSFGQLEAQLVGLLPLVDPGSRDDLRREILGHLATSLSILPFASYEADALAPLLSPAERDELLSLASRLSPEAEARIIVACWRCEPDRAQAWVDSFLARRAGASDASMAQGLLVLMAVGLDVGLHFAELAVEREQLSGSAETQRAFFASKPNSVLEAYLDEADAEIIGRIIDSWSVHPQFDRSPLVGAAERAISRLPGPGEATLLRARLATRKGIGAKRPDLLARVYREASALPDASWIKFEGLGLLLGVLPHEDRAGALEAFLKAGKAVGYMVSGVTALRGFVANIPPTGIAAMLDELSDATPFVRAMTLPVLLEHATDDLAPTIARAILQEADRSGHVGDLLPCAHRLPPAILPDLARAMDRILPPAALVRAVTALSNTFPVDLLAWLRLTWPSLRPAERIRAAAASSEVAALYESPEAALIECCRAIGIAKADLDFGRVDAGEVERVVAQLPVTAVPEFLARAPEILAVAVRRCLDEFIQAFGQRLTPATLRALLEELPEGLTERTAGTLARFIPLLPDEAPHIRRRLVDHYVALQDRWGAAKLVALHGGVLDAGELRALTALSLPETGDLGSTSLDIAAHPHLGRAEQAAIEEAPALRPSIGPGFVELLDRSLYPAEFLRMLDERVLAWDLGGRARTASAFSDAKKLASMQPSSVRLLAEAAQDPRSVATLLALSLAGGHREGLETTCGVIERFAPLLKEQFGEDICSGFASTFANLTRLHAR